MVLHGASPAQQSGRHAAKLVPVLHNLSFCLATTRGALHRRRTAALRRTGGFGLRPYLLPRLLQLRVQRHRPIWRLHNLRCPSREAQARQRQRSISMRPQDVRKKLPRAGGNCASLPVAACTLWEENSKTRASRVDPISPPKRG